LVPRHFWKRQRLHRLNYIVVARAGIAPVDAQRLRRTSCLGDSHLVALGHEAPRSFLLKIVAQSPG